MVSEPSVIAVVVMLIDRCIMRPVHASGNQPVYCLEHVVGAGVIDQEVQFKLLTAGGLLSRPQERAPQVFGQLLQVSHGV